MRIQNVSNVSYDKNISANKNMKSAPAFGAGYVALLPRNHGNAIARDIIKPFNENLLPDLLSEVVKSVKSVITAASPEITKVDTIKTSKNLVEDVNFFILAGGKGSRFHQLASSVGDYNKISLPIHLQDGSAFHMLDMPLAMGKYFLGKEGYKPITETHAPGEKSGTLDHIVKHYMSGNKIKDTVVCCGDNFFGTPAEELTSFFIKAINDKNTHLAQVGVERTPKEVAKRFGVLEVEVNPNTSQDIMKLKGFEEKPALELAEKMVTPNGKNIANTGMLYISKEAMGKLIDELKNGVNNISKDENEQHDFAMATKYIHKQIPEWFGLKSGDGAAVKVVKKWEDVGEPEALYRFYDAIAKDGEYVHNLPNKHAKDVQETLRNKTRLGEDQPNRAILFSKTIPNLNEIPPANLLSDTVKAVRIIEGVKIIVAERM